MGIQLQVSDYKKFKSDSCNWTPTWSRADYVTNSGAENQSRSKILLYIDTIKPVIIKLHVQQYNNIRLHTTILIYNIASRAAQLNSVNVRVLKIPIVHSDDVSKSLRQNFFNRAAIVSAGKNIIFRDNNRYKQKISPKTKTILLPFFWARVLKWGTKEKNKGKENWHQRRHDWLHRSDSEMQQLLTERHSSKTEQMINCFVSKVSFNFSVLILLNIKLEFSTENLK